MEERKEFKFYRSYYDVFEKLTTVRAKYEFIKALLDKEFLNVEPMRLSRDAEFAYISQKHSIERQCKGFIDRQLRNDPKVDPAVGGKADPKQQIEKEEKKEKERVIQESFLMFWDMYDHKQDRKPCEKLWRKIPTSEYSRIFAHVPVYVKSTPDKAFRKHPKTYLNQEAWNNDVIAPAEVKPEQKYVSQFKDLGW